MTLLYKMKSANQITLQKAQRNRKLIKGISLIVGVIGMGLSTTAHAQTRGRLEVIKDPRIDSLIAHRYSSNKGSSKSGSFISTYGYRVQFFSGSNRKDAFSAQNKFQQLHPELRTYITYREPNFKVEAGDFRTRLEAAKLMQSLRGQFISLFVISEKINPPNLDTPTP